MKDTALWWLPDITLSQKDDRLIVSCNTWYISPNILHDSVAILHSFRHNVMDRAWLKYKASVGSPCAPDQIHMMINKTINFTVEQIFENISGEFEAIRRITQKQRQWDVTINVTMMTRPYIEHHCQLLSTGTCRAEVEQQLLLVLCFESNNVVWRVNLQMAAAKPLCIEHQRTKANKIPAVELHFIIPLLIRLCISTSLVCGSGWVVRIVIVVLIRWILFGCIRVVRTNPGTTGTASPLLLSGRISHQC